MTQDSTTPLYDGNNEGDGRRSAPCIACQKHHEMGQCPLKLAGVEYCGLCGLAHYGHPQTCPHLKSVSRCRMLLEALKQSPETIAEIEHAKKFLIGNIGDLQRKKREKQEEAKRSNQQGHAGSAMAPSYPIAASQPMAGFHAREDSSTDAYPRYPSNLSTANTNGNSDSRQGVTRMPVVNGAPHGPTLPRGGRPPGHP